MTGKSAIENRVLDNEKWLRPDHDQMGVHTWPHKLVQLGYHTAAIGKMHFYPWDIMEGFQHRVIAEDKRHIGIQDDYTLFLKKHGYNRLHGNAHKGFYENKGAIVSLIPEKYQIDRYVCDQTCEYLDCLNDEKPFALMVGFPGPHCPYDPTSDSLDKMDDHAKFPIPLKATKDTDMCRDENIKSNKGPWNGIDLTNFKEDEKYKIRRHYSAMVQVIDEHVGTIVEKLKKKGIYDNTIIIFTADHGDFLGDFNMCGKEYFYESSCKIPMIIRYPGKKHQIIDGIVSLTDLHNTLVVFAGGEVNDTPDCTTIQPFGKNIKRDPILGSTRLGWMLRDEQYQYTVYYNGLRELYDYVKDPGQQKNLLRVNGFESVEERMRTQLVGRVIKAINDANLDMNAKSLSEEFNYAGWKRPYPYKK